MTVKQRKDALRQAGELRQAAQKNSKKPVGSIDDFVYRLPTFIADVTRRLEDRIQQAEGVDLQIRTARRRLSAAKRSAPRVDSNLSRDVK